MFVFLEVLHACFNPVGDRFATCSTDCNILVYRVADEEGGQAGIAHTRVPRPTLAAKRFTCLCLLEVWADFLLN